MVTGPLLRRPLPGSFVTAAVLAILAGGPAGHAVAEEWCFPHCDYVHYYGPYDFTYNQPGLYGYPQQCGPHGDCTPHLAYVTGVPRRLPAGRITVRLPRLMTPAPQQQP
jgi:hypothetical protein